MKEKLLHFIKDSSFPCVMAKAVVKKGNLSFNQAYDLEDPQEQGRILDNMYSFVDEYRKDDKKLSSFVLNLTNPAYNNFKSFEKIFWKFLYHLSLTDKQNFIHDPRVSDDPNSPRFSFSIKSEAFFILVLHPLSPRMARRFSSPTIIFNPHKQFEDLRNNGIFHKVRNLIRQRDKILQGFINPMVQDYGERSEVFQYIGRVYEEKFPCPL